MNICPICNIQLLSEKFYRCEKCICSFKCSANIARCPICDNITKGFKLCWTCEKCKSNFYEYYQEQKLYDFSIYNYIIYEYIVLHYTSINRILKIRRILNLRLFL